jgi:hypothetical protein
MQLPRSARRQAARANLDGPNNSAYDRSEAWNLSRSSINGFAASLSPTGATVSRE